MRRAWLGVAAACAASASRAAAGPTPNATLASATKRPRGDAAPEKLRRALAADPSADFVNIFTAVDNQKYLVELVASMRQAYTLSLDARRGRRFKWFVLYGGALDAATICDAAKVVHASRADARAEWTGCLDLGVATFPDDKDCVADAGRYASLKTVNAFRLDAVPGVLEEIYEWTHAQFRGVTLSGSQGDVRDENGKHLCHARLELINYMNFAPDAVDRFLLPYGVKRVALLDADVAPSGRFPGLYDHARPEAPDRVVTALSRHVDDCDHFFERFNASAPVVAHTLGGDREAMNQKRFRADCFVIRDLERYCRLGVADRVVDALRLQVASHRRLWKCGLQQPPLILAASNFTDVLRHYDLRLVGTDGADACQHSPDEFNFHHYSKKGMAMSGCRHAAGYALDEFLDLLRAISPEHPSSVETRRTPGCEKV